MRCLTYDGRVQLEMSLCVVLFYTVPAGCLLVTAENCCTAGTTPVLYIRRIIPAASNTSYDVQEGGAVFLKNIIIRRIKVKYFKKIKIQGMLILIDLSLSVGRSSIVSKQVSVEY